MAPELIFSKQFDKSVDVYSYGMILYEMYTKKVPFKEYDNIQEAIKKQKRPEINIQDSSKTDKLVTLIEKCWDQDPMKRPTFDKIYELLSSHEVKFPECQDTGVDILLRYISEQQCEGISPYEISEIYDLRDEFTKKKYNVTKRVSEAINNGLLEELSELIVAIPGYNINIKENGQEPLLCIAAKVGNVDVINFLLNIKNVDPNIQNDKGLTPAMIAILSNKISALKEILKHPRYDISTRDHSSKTVLHYAAAQEKHDFLKVLIDSRKSDIKNILNVYDENGKTPLDIDKNERIKKLMSSYKQHTNKH